MSIHRRLAARGALVGLLLSGCTSTSPTLPTNGSATPPATTQTGPELPLAQAGWTVLPDGPLSARHDAVAAWVDGSFVVFGGRDTPRCPPNADCALRPEPTLVDGARFDVATGSWAPIAPTPVAVEEVSTAVVDGSLYVWSYAPWAEDASPDFLALDVSSDTWTVLPTPDVDPGWAHLVEGLGGEPVLVQTSHEGGRREDLRFDPTTTSWEPMDQDPLGPSFDRDLTRVGDRLVLTGIQLRPQPGGADGPARFRAATWTSVDGWEPLPVSPIIGYDRQWLAVGDRLVNPTTGGSDGGAVNGYGRTLPFGGMLDPTEGVWTSLPDGAGPQRSGIVSVAVGDDRLVVNAVGWALQVEAQRWFSPGAPLDDAPDTFLDGAATTVGAGRLFVFGGSIFGGGRGGGVGQLVATAWTWSPPG